MGRLATLGKATRVGSANTYADALGIIRRVGMHPMNDESRPFADTCDVAKFKKTAQLGNARDIRPKAAFPPFAVARNLADWTL